MTHALYTYLGVSQVLVSEVDSTLQNVSGRHKQRFHAPLAEADEPQLTISEHSSA